MSEFVVPSSLTEGRTAEPAAWWAWIADLPAIVAGLADRWELELEEPFQPGGHNSWVAPARERTGRDRVLKVGWTHDEARDEGAGLAAWNGHGAVGLHATHTEGPTTALLLDRARPGTTLSEGLPVAEQDLVVAGVLRTLWAADPGPHPFRPLAQMCAGWADEAAVEHERVPERLDPGLVRVGLSLFRELPTTATESRLLATDLHAENLLAADDRASGEREWRLIDPKPYRGDPAYDVLQHLLNGLPRVTADPVGVSGRLAELTGLDPDRVLTWLFARAVQEAPSWPGTPELARAIAATGRV